MQAGITAVILSKTPQNRVIEGVDVVEYISTCKNAKELHDARINSLWLVKTSHFFWLDDDDDLPDDYLDVLQDCLDTQVAIAYTNEVAIDVETGQRTVFTKAPYDQTKHAKDPLFIHSLALCQTELARAACMVIPRGTYVTEGVLYFELAKHGAAFIDRIGYIWNRKKSGVSLSMPSIVRGLINNITYNTKQLEVV